MHGASVILLLLCLACLHESAHHHSFIRVRQLLQCSQGGQRFPQLIMQSLYTTGGADGHKSIHATRLPPGHPPGDGGGGPGPGGPGGGGGEGGEGGPVGIVVPCMSHEERRQKHTAYSIRTVHASQHSRPGQRTVAQLVTRSSLRTARPFHCAGPRWGGVVCARCLRCVCLRRSHGAGLLRRTSRHRTAPPW